MDDKNYGKYVITEQRFPKPLLDMQADPKNKGPRILYLDDNVIPGAFYLSAAWWTKASSPGEKGDPPSHSHDFDEVIAFFGSNPEDPLDLGGEIELWLGGEQHLINRTCLVFIPRGISHCPIKIRRLDRPILHFSTAPSYTYSKQEAAHEE
jgi:hypothetical protein